MKLENYGYALNDSEESIKADETYPKAYYRKAMCLFNIGKLKESL